MKLTSLKVRGVFGYMDFRLSFDKQLTFLVGINGSGKTTALRLLEALLTPSLQQLDSIPHKSAELRLRDGANKSIRIISQVSEEKTTIRLPHLGQEGELSYPRPSPPPSSRGSMSEAAQEPYNLLYTQFAENPVLKFLRLTLDTPLFLGLERRNVALHFEDEPRGAISSPESKRREYFQLAIRRRMMISGQLGSSLVDVQFLIQEIYRKTRERQDAFTKRLREEIFLDAFIFQPRTGFFKALRHRKTPAPFLESITKKKPQVERALSDAGMAPEAYSPVVNRFFTHIAELARKAQTLSLRADGAIDETTIELAFNRPVVDRVLKLVSSAETYTADVRQLWAPIDQFLDLVNRFLADSGKRLEIDQVGLLNVVLPDGTRRPLDALSSGERQIVVILGHLAITREHNRAGIFVVDEPELSLHLKWQEIFVDSILQASPQNQFILATHSPAIVMERNSYCESLDRSAGRETK